ncbi:MAG TPA: sulfite exporter TauE/SafE family protein [Thermoanaerobaculia bacterium]|nr:sulfite exporter TauE/SafE family protein [Thermoanaerobaculia bacterium]
MDHCCSAEEGHRPGIAGLLSVVAAGIAAWGLLRLTAVAGVLPAVPAWSRGMGFGLLFAAGLLTGFHCVGMCGGFVLSYSQQGGGRWPRHLSYALGKTLSYTALGALCGLVGGAVSLTPTLRGGVALVAGIVLVLLGLRSLGFFSGLHVSVPSRLLRFAQRRAGPRPFAMGLANGLMIACGPLQALYVLALGTGSAVEGASLLFVFGLGTLPLLLGFGWLAGRLGVRFGRRALAVTAWIVVVLGIAMVNRGLALAGGYDLGSLVVRATPASAGGECQVVRMEVRADGYSPGRFAVEKGKPVCWVIDGKEINACNRTIEVPALDLTIEVRPGEQVVRLDPENVGILPWSCSMGMMRGSFVVREAGP